MDVSSLSSPLSVALTILGGYCTAPKYVCILMHAQLGTRAHLARTSPDPSTSLVTTFGALYPLFRPPRISARRLTIYFCIFFFLSFDELLDSLSISPASYPLIPPIIIYSSNKERPSCARIKYVFVVECRICSSDNIGGSGAGTFRDSRDADLFPFSPVRQDFRRANPPIKPGVYRTLRVNFRPSFVEGGKHSPGRPRTGFSGNTCLQMIDLVKRESARALSRTSQSTFDEPRLLP